MWKRIAKRAGREAISIVAAGIAAYAADSPYLLFIKPLLTVAGKWMRERGFQNVPF